MKSDKNISNEKLSFENKKKLADIGQIEACYDIAKMFFSGVGCEIDYIRSRHYAHIAALGGHSEAMVMYAVLLLKDNALTRDNPEIVQWLQRAGSAGIDVAYVLLAHMYRYGIGVAKDSAKSDEYLCLAAAQGNKISESIMLDGFDSAGLPLDPQVRHELMLNLNELISAKDGDLKAINEIISMPDDNQLEDIEKLGVCLLNNELERDFIEATMELASSKCSKSDVAKNIAKLEGSIEGGVPGAATYLATMYLEGALVPRDEAKAAELFELDAKLNVDQAMYALSKLYGTGRGVERDLKLGWHYAKLAADLGHIDAKFALGQMYRQGVGVDIDGDKAVNYFLEAIEGGHAIAMYVLAFMYFKGDCVECDISKCINLLERSAKAGYSEAMVSLSEFYGGGLGVKADHKKSKQWLIKAAELGNVRAQQMISDLESN